MKTLDWYGLYGEGWQNEIVSEAFSHPAKFSRALIRRIYEHAIERGWLAEGDAVLDPFAGVGLGAADALASGLDWTGNELELHFVDMGRGCECDGISKEDWRRCFGRWKRFAHRDGRHWCPQCLAEAGRIIGERKAPRLNQTQAKRRKKMRKLMRKTGRSVDFRLYEPMPFPDSLGCPLKVKEPHLFGEPTPAAWYKRNSGKIPCTKSHHYVGNLELFAKHSRNGARAVLLQGDSRDLLAVLGGARAQACVSSPPYAASATKGARENRAANLEQAGIDSKTWLGKRRCTQGRSEGYGADPANLGNMREGDYAAAIISSPPYTSDGVGHDGGHPRLDAIEDERRASEGCARRPAYGQSAGQLGAMKEGDVDAVISSPPYADRCANESQRTMARTGKILQMNEGDGKVYGQSPGQLAAMPEGAFEATAVVSSPPWESNLARDGRGIDLKIHKQLQEKYHRRYTERSFPPDIYGESDGQLGQEQGDTFWSAAKTVVQQCWLALAPGGVAIWVLKAFVRDKKIVDFPDQWRRMCEACGFESLEWIRAWLVEDRGAQWALDGKLVEKRVERKSFFRRLAEKKGSPRIDYEIVLVMRKAEAI